MQIAMPYIRVKEDLTRSPQHIDMNAFRRLSVSVSIPRAVAVLADASCCVLRLSPVSTSDAAAALLIW